MSDEALPYADHRVWRAQVISSLRVLAAEPAVRVWRCLDL